MSAVGHGPASCSIHAD